MIPIRKIPDDVLRKMEALGIEVAPGVVEIGDIYVDGRRLPDDRLAEEIEAIYRRCTEGRETLSGASREPLSRYAD